MIRKFLFSFLLLTFSFVNFLQGQNMWEEFHLNQSLGNIKFLGSDAWIECNDGAIKLDTSSWNYEFFNFTEKPQIILSSSAISIPPSIYDFSENQSGEIAFMQTHRILTFDGNNFQEQLYPNLSVNPVFVAYDSLGNLWYQDNSSMVYDSSNNWSYTYSNYSIVAIDTNKCFIVGNWSSNGFNRICSPGNIDTFITPFTADYNIFNFDSRNNQWKWKWDSLKLYRFDGTSMTVFSGINFPVNDTPAIFYPMDDTTIFFTGFFNNPSGELAYIFRPSGINQLNTSQLNLNPSDNVTYYISPTKRIFAEVSGFYVFARKLYSTIDGINWQYHNFSDINIIGLPQIDSIHNFYVLDSNSVKKFSTNWSVQNFQIPTDIHSPISYLNTICSSSNGIVWIEKQIDTNSVKIFRIDFASNQVDSSIIFMQQYNNAFHFSLVAATDTKFWAIKFDTIFECNLLGVIHNYVAPDFYGSGISFSGYDNYLSSLCDTLYWFAHNITQDSTYLFKLSNGNISILNPTGQPHLTQNSFSRDHQNNIWCSSKTAIYKFNGSIWDSIPLPFIITTIYGAHDPRICFDDSDNLFIILHDGWYSSHFYKYTFPTWTEFPAPTPATVGDDLFSKDGFLWTFNGQSLLRFDQNGFPNTLGSSYIVKGKTYHDLNANNIQNTNETGKQNVLIQSSSGDFSFTQLNGNYLILCDSGQNIITCDPPLYYNSSPASIVINNTGANPVVDSVDFALQPLPGMNDLSVDVTHYPFITWNTNPGISYWVNVKNPGTTVQSATLSFNVPDTLVVAYVYPTPTSTNGNQLSWSLNNLAIDTSLQFYIAASFQLPTPIGSTLVAIADVQSTNTDLTPANNIDTVSYLVTGPYDPNMKLVDPMGEGALGITDTTHHIFTYTIYFQNTGNDTAVNVRVDDFLDADFDWTSFNLISSSSPVDFDLNQNGLLRFHFNNIMLTDSNVNEPMSHGFAKYSLRLKPGPSLGKQLTNAASIYFDYQPPIFTNSTLNTIGMETGIGAVSYNSNSVTLFPNPSGGLVTVLSNGNKMKFFSVYDLSGRLCYTQEASTNQATINIQSLAQGLYLVKIKLQNGTTELKKLVKE